MNKKKTETVVDTLGELTEPVAGMFDYIEQEINKRVEPERKSALKRYPRLFTLLVVFAVVIVYYGFEKIVDQTFLSNYPVLMIFVGVGILVFTGTLYKKL